MGFMKSNEGKKGLVRAFFHVTFNPPVSFSGNYSTTKPCKLSNLFAVSDKIFWVFMTRGSIVLCCKPMIKTKIPRLRLIIFIEPTVAMPFTRHACCIANALKHLWNRKFIFLEMKLSFRGNPIIYPCSVRCPSSK